VIGNWSVHIHSRVATAPGDVWRHCPDRPQGWLSPVVNRCTRQRAVVSNHRFHATH